LMPLRWVCRRRRRALPLRLLHGQSARRPVLRWLHRRLPVRPRLVLRNSGGPYRLLVCRAAVGRPPASARVALRLPRPRCLPGLLLRGPFRRVRLRRVLLRGHLWGPQRHCRHRQYLRPHAPRPVGVFASSASTTCSASTCFHGPVSLHFHGLCPCLLDLVGDLLFVLTLCSFCPMSMSPRRTRAPPMPDEYFQKDSVLQTLPRLRRIANQRPQPPHRRPSAKGRFRADWSISEGRRQRSTRPRTTRSQSQTFRPQSSAGPGRRHYRPECDGGPCDPRPEGSPTSRSFRRP